jgi:hypothetical protein
MAVVYFMFYTHTMTSSTEDYVKLLEAHAKENGHRPPEYIEIEAWGWCWCSYMGKRILITHNEHPSLNIGRQRAAQAMCSLLCFTV